eukprot:scaffold1495_cov117-Skeletonema_marinoi.AAC.1
MATMRWAHHPKTGRAEANIPQTSQVGRSKLPHQMKMFLTTPKQAIRNHRLLNDYSAGKFIYITKRCRTGRPKTPYLIAMVVSHG